MKRFMLAQRLHGKPTGTLTVEETALVKRLIAKAYPVMITGLAWTALDPNSVAQNK